MVSTEVWCQSFVPWQTGWENSMAGTVKHKFTQPNYQENYPPWNQQQVYPWKWMAKESMNFLLGPGPISGANMLVSGRVYI